LALVSYPEIRIQEQMPATLTTARVKRKNRFRRRTNIRPPTLGSADAVLACDGEDGKDFGSRFADAGGIPLKK
jgi:hypothetical protein